MKMKGLKELIFGNCHKGFGFTKEDSFYLLKKQRKKDLVIFDTTLTKKYQAQVKLKNIMTYFLKNMKNPQTIKNYRKTNQCWHKISYCGHPNTAFKLSKPIRHLKL